MTTPIRLVLVDDHRMFRSGVKTELDPEVTEVVGEAPDVDEAVKVIKATKPDVVLLDVHLPGGNGNGGVDVISASKFVETEAGQPVRFLALSVGLGRGRHRRHPRRRARLRDEDDLRQRPHDGDPAGVRGRRGLQPAAGRLRARRVRRGRRRDRRGETRSSTGCRRASVEVMRLIARGYQYKEVAKELFISVKTVETHVSSVLRKLQLSSRHELTAWAMGRRLL